MLQLLDSVEVTDRASLLYTGRFRDEYLIGTDDVGTANKKKATRKQAMISVLTNVASLEAQRNLANTQNSLSQSIGRLSSGMRINSASDDAAGLGISESLKADITLDGAGAAQLERRHLDVAGR